MTTVAIAPTGVAVFPEGGGHFWVYAQYAYGLLSLGCDVYWIERFEPAGDRHFAEEAATTFFSRMKEHGLEDRAALWTPRGAGPNSGVGEVLGMSPSAFRRAVANADLFLNFDYRVDPRVLGAGGTTAVVDIDPGLFQFWVDEGQIEVPPHDRYTTIGETVGAPEARFSDCGVDWLRFHPPVALDQWPSRFDPTAEAFTTVTSWWGGAGGGEWLADRNGMWFENNKRVTFLEFVDLPPLVTRPLELAMNVGPVDLDDHDSLPDPAALQHDADRRTDYAGDAEDIALLRSRGWRIRHSAHVAADPVGYRAYIQQSRGEFSCVKPSCRFFENAWISDRTVSYLASGKPAVVQHTGASSYLPDSEGLFRFRSLEEAVASFEAIESDYARQCRSARALAEEYFDAVKVLSRLLDQLLT